MRALALVIAIGAAGCAMGAGTSTVGIWRPKRVVDAQVCIQTTADKCDREVVIARDSPARSFGGGLLTFASPGYARLSSKTGGQSAVAINNYLEYLRGRGGLAVGLRVGGNFYPAGESGDAGKLTVITVPVSLVGHIGWDRISFYAGAGYTPYATRQYITGTMEEMNEKVTDFTMHGPNFLAGTRYILRPGDFAVFSVSFEVLHQRLSDMDTTAFTSAIGLHF